MVRVGICLVLGSITGPAGRAIQSEITNVHALIIEINFWDRKEGSMVSSIICDPGGI